MRFLSFALLPALALAAQTRLTNLTTEEASCISGCAQTIAPNVSAVIRSCKNASIVNAPSCYCNSQDYLYSIGNCIFDACPELNATKKVFEQCNNFRHNGAGANLPTAASILLGAAAIVASVLLA
ncbi:hypothetical protein AURDEDRAFT_166584 [Auricularia subglabra TFB-10046 SS5]|nr:hypothetical protein AURDEDRAFT_166584 [Auricularia subglabra TFB-10046 SS5]